MIKTIISKPNLMKKNSKSNSFASRLLTTGIAMTMATSMWAQSNVVTGTVKDDTGEPIVGATVLVKGTGKGAVTDIDGNFSLKADKGQTLQISYVGMGTKEASVNGKPITIVLKDEANLDDVYVIGYGVQKKSVATAAIAKVSAEDLEGKSRLRADDALKGLAAGVTVTSTSGQPGAMSTIRIRGIGTINNSEPLYIIDGLATDKYGMELVNPSDIESMEVLKDAASAAIYGTRGANGVILVTTKKGKQGKAKITYNASFGWQNAWRHRDVTGASDYAVLMNEKYVNGGFAPIYADPFKLKDVNGDEINGFGTDWQKEVFNNNAPITQHDVSVSGASEKTSYYLSLGYFDQDGIVGGNYGQSNYDRLTLRSNATHNLFDDSKERNFLNKLDIGVNIGFMQVHNTGIDANSTWGSPLGSALYLAPTLPVTVKGETAADMLNHYSQYELYRDENNNPYTIPGYVGSYNEQNNPIALLHGNPQKNWSRKIMPRFNVDLQIWDNIKYHFSYSAEVSHWGNEGATKQLYFLSGNNNSDRTQASAMKANSMSWTIDNSITYDKTFGNHTIGIVLGQEASKYSGDQLEGYRYDLVNVNKPSINYATGNVVLAKDEEGNITGAQVRYGVSGYPYVEHRLASLFGRVSYNYDEKYMAQFTLRRDGSTRFGANHHYGYFPSVSAGWNITREKFMSSTSDWLSNAKLRVSWGKNGNDNIGDFAYTTLTEMGATSNYYFGGVSQLYNGSKANRLANADLHWEESEQTDLGLDLAFFNSALTFSVDYFNKRTNGMIIEMPIPSYVGENKPLGNVGDMVNSGWEFELGYKFNVADARFDIKGNASYLHNELRNLGNDTGFINYGIDQLSGGGTRAENGQPFPYFYGYKTAGVFQNMDEVRAYTKDGQMIMPNATPGDLRFVDINGDGKITADDRTNIGNATPKWSFGLNLNAAWKGFDLGLFLQGVAGVDIFDATFRQDIASGNYPTWVLNRWTGEGTSNKLPLLKQGDAQNWMVSDIYVNDGSFCRLKNIQLGYTIPKSITQKIRFDRIRVYVMAENLFTWTKYHGFDPEIGTNAGKNYSPYTMGVDYGVYPQARTFTVGFNLAL